ncbi:MAG TPA: hypothetical protein VM487_01485, partial [Phycisphaerae bacterium]|nr:hypothetical protein [Phycisphaerae bacterium]
KVQPILDDLIPAAQPSAISFPSSVSRANMTPGLTEALVEARARVLAHDLKGEICYLFSEDTVKYQYPPGAEVSCENYVEVMRDLEHSPARVERAPGRVRHFLVSGVLSPQAPPGS